MLQVREKSKYQIIVRYLVDFCSRSPGLGYLARKDIHWCEFLYWILVICLMLIFGNYSALKLIISYKSRNSAITLNVDYMHVNTLFPATTICPQQILDAEKVENLSRSLPDLKNDEDRAKFKLFLQNLSKISGREANYFNLTYAYITERDYMETIFNLSQVYKVTIEDQPAVKIMTEVGICYTTNSLLHTEMHTKNWFDSKPFPNRWSKQFIPDVKQFNFTDRYPLTKIIRHNIPGNMSIYVHSPYELPTTWWRVAAIAQGRQTIQLTVSVNEIIYGDNLLIEMGVDERNCRAINESNLIMFPSSYSRNLCLMQCRASYIYRLCHCLPHFYRNRHVSQTLRTRVCNIQGLNCYVQHMKLFRNINANSNSLIFKCQCYPNCIEQIAVVKIKEFYPQTNKSEVILAIEYPPTESYKRSVMYSRIDYIVTLFSVMSTFLGASILSAIDFIYFFAIRIYWYRQGYRGSVDSH